MRVLVNSPATIDVTFYADETPTDSSDPVTVTVKALDGTVVLDAVTADHVGSSGSGTYQCNLPAQPNVDYLLATWVGAFSGSPTTIATEIEIVGRRLFTLAELRASAPVLSNKTTYPTAVLATARDQVEDEFSKILGAPVVPRMGYETVEAEDSVDLYLSYPRVTKLLTISQDGTPFTDDQINALNLYGSRLRRTDTIPWAPVFVIGNHHGWPLVPSFVTIKFEWSRFTITTPEDVKRVALKYARILCVANVVDNAIPERSTTFDAPDGNRYSLATAGRAGYETGIPDVDAVLGRYAGDAGPNIG